MYSNTFDFVTLKYFNDGTEKVYIKRGSLPGYKEKKEEKSLPKISNALVSAHRAKNLLIDLADSNKWDFFITLTFGNEETDGQRLNDIVVKGLFQRWRKFFKRKFPDMKYLIVPEYHEKGGLHFHGIIGNVSFSDLGLVDSGKVCCSWLPKKCCSRDYFERNKEYHDLKPTDGETIYNCTVWKYGFSTVTLVKSSLAVKNYVSKYISKGGIDPRFFNKKRFWSSHNLERPYIEKIKHLLGTKQTDFNGEIVLTKGFIEDIGLDMSNYVIEYSSDDKFYMVLRKKTENDILKEREDITIRKTQVLRIV